MMDYDIQRAQAHVHGGGNDEGDASLFGIESPWGKAFTSTAIISIIPTLILPMIPLTTSKNGVVSLNQGLHSVLLSFAAGGLLGEVFLHSIPHLLAHHDHFSRAAAHDDHYGHEKRQLDDEHDHHHHQDEDDHHYHDEDHDHHHDDHHHHHTNNKKGKVCDSHSHDKEDGDHHHGHDHGEVSTVSLWVLAGFLIFFISEKLVKIVLGDDADHHHHHHHQHEQQHTEMPHINGSSSSSSSNGCSEEQEANGLRRRSERLKLSPASSSSSSSPRNNGIESSSRRSGARSSNKVVTTKSGEKEVGSSSSSSSSLSISGGHGLKASGYLNIIIDALHNLTDGIAIGAAFASGKGFGIATTLSVFLHEIPHEIGDFAILVQSGFSLRNAFLMQFCTAIAAFVGTFIGLVSKR